MPDYDLDKMVKSIQEMKGVYHPFIYLENRQQSKLVISDDNYDSQLDKTNSRCFCCVAIWMC